MRHRKAGVKLNRTTSHRQAMFRNMVTSLFKHDRIRTTDVKAKELRRWADHIITLAKRGDLHARRQVLAIMQEKDVVHKLFEEAGKRFGSVNGGYTRIIKIGRRPGDAAPVSVIELIADEEKSAPKKRSKATAKKKAADSQTKPAEATAKEKTGVSETKETVEPPGEAAGGQSEQRAAEQVSETKPAIEAAAEEAVEPPVEDDGQAPVESEKK